MFRFLKNRSDASRRVKMADMDGTPLKEGDIVISYRYDMGRCKIVSTDQGFVYESLESGKQVNWARMIDARTELQKVKKISEKSS
ncbi:MAG TPA: hypothetical protein ENN63_06995 [Bacteroidetes bacterium]|nr:hypothetical protein [Bacteroidota bacterium]